MRVRVALEFDNIETIKRAIEIGAGVSLLPEPTIAREIESGSLVQVPLEGVPLVRPLGIIHRRDRKLSETAQQFIQLLQSQSATVPATADRLQRTAIRHARDELVMSRQPSATEVPLLLTARRFDGSE